MTSFEPRHHLSPARHRGLTLVELLVTMAAFIVVMGLALGMMTETEHATRQITRYQAGVQYGQNALNEAVRLIRSAAAPGNFPTLGPDARLKPRFAKNEIALIVRDADSPSGFSRASIAEETRNGDVIDLKRRLLPLGDTATSAPAARIAPLGGGPPERCRPSIRFAYATAPRPGQKANYQDEWTTTTPPALVQVTVRVRVGNDAPRRDEVTLQTAVIPGLMPLRAQVAAAPLPPTDTAPPRIAPSTTPAPTPAPGSPPSAAATPTPAADKPVKVLAPESPVKTVKKSIPLKEAGARR